MENRSQVLVIEPPIELTFTGPFTEAVYSYMKLKNPSDRKVCFKIKTTAPERYFVKPYSGAVDPNSEVQIAVSLLPFDYDPTEKIKHKFMVLSVFTPDGDVNHDTLWKEIGQDELMESKLKCAFAMPAGQEQNSAQEVGNDNEPTIRVQQPSPPAPSVAVSQETDCSEELNAAVAQMEKLNEDLSQLRQENIVLKVGTIILFLGVILGKFFL